MSSRSPSFTYSCSRRVCSLPVPDDIIGRRSSCMIHVAPLAAGQLPSLVWVAPFGLLLLAIALLPLIPHTHHWWERNRNKLLVGLVFAVVTLIHFASRGFGTTLHEPVL